MIKLIDIIQKGKNTLLFDKALSDIKYQSRNTLSEKLLYKLYENKIQEIKLSIDNAAEIYGDYKNGNFTVGDYDYSYRIIQLPKNPYESDSFYNVDFSEVGNKNPNLSLPTGNAGKNYIKILSTMYRVILNFTNEYKPEYIGISALEGSGYWNIYNELTKTNSIPGYSRNKSNIPITTSQGIQGKMIVLKKIGKN